MYARGEYRSSARRANRTVRLYSSEKAHRAPQTPHVMAMSIEAGAYGRSKKLGAQLVKELYNQQLVMPFEVEKDMETLMQVTHQWCKLFWDVFQLIKSVGAENAREGLELISCVSSFFSSGIIVPSDCPVQELTCEWV